MRQAKAIEIFDYPIESIYSTNQYHLQYQSVPFTVPISSIYSTNRSVPFTVPIDLYSVNDVENISYEIRTKNKSQ